ncbi:MAG: NAD(P)/FAD-dependent oxidoreductase [Pseudomonadota bacterium]
MFLTAASAAMVTACATSRRASVDGTAIVVGAGAAGLGAARTLADAGCRVIVLEAAQRIGGRAYTETDTFGLPYDRGCHWLHDGGNNPLVGYGRRHGFDVYGDPGREMLISASAVGEHRLADWYAAQESYFADVEAGLRTNSDASLGDFLADDHPWHSQLVSLIADTWYGKEPAEISAAYVLDEPDGENWLCREGLGALVAHIGRGIPVQLGAAVERIRWAGRKVIVEASIGTLRADAVIVTVSTGVLASDSIRFDPALPTWKREAIAAYPMGVYNHVGLRYRGDVPGLGENLYVTPDEPGRRAPGLLYNVDGSGLHMLWTGGDLSRDLERAGPEAAIAWGRDHLADLLGSDIDTAFETGTFSRWGQNPWTRGSYASARPGGHKQREALRRPLADRLFFAGDACHPVSGASVGRAFETGIMAAEATAAVLRSA